MLRNRRYRDAHSSWKTISGFIRKSDVYIRNRRNLIWRIHPVQWYSRHVWTSQSHVTTVTTGWLSTLATMKLYLAVSRDFVTDTLQHYFIPWTWLMLVLSRSWPIVHAFRFASRRRLCHLIPLTSNLNKQSAYWITFMEHNCKQSSVYVTPVCSSYFMPNEYNNYSF